MKRQFVLKKNYGFLAEGTLLTEKLDGNYQVDTSDINVKYIHCNDIMLSCGLVEGRPDIFKEVKPTMISVNKGDLLERMSAVMDSYARYNKDAGAGAKRMIAVVKGYLEELSDD